MESVFYLGDGAVIFKYKKVRNCLLVMDMLSLPLLVVLVVWELWWILGCYGLIWTAANVYLASLWRCPYCRSFLPSNRALVRNEGGCCPRCGMDIPEREEDMDMSFFDDPGSAK